MKYLLFLSLLFFTFIASAIEIKVGKAEKYSRIQDAINAADSGDVINVNEGTYSEGNILVNKPVTICATGKVIVEGKNKTEIFTISSSHVIIEGLTIQNSGYSDIKELAGIKLLSVTSCTIQNNHLINNYFGIYLANSSECKISSNLIEGSAKTEASSGNGIHLWKSSNNTISNNHVSGHRDGIYFEFVKNSFIRANVSEKNLRYGLHFMFSDNDTYEYNTFRNNGSGVAVMYTRNVIMRNNRFEQNWGGAAYGLLLKEITHSEVMHNYFSKNTTGIYMEGTSSSLIHHNTFSENGWAVKIWGDCSNDTLWQNNFSGNTFDVSTNATTSYNFFYNNYWDHYTGYDLNHDTFGDVPFHPVSLYSKMTEESPYTLMLLHSFLVNILDQAEKMMPSVTPVQFVDERPLMKPVRL